MDSLELKTVFARNCHVRRIDKPEASSFLKENHRMGDAQCRYRYGLFVDRNTSGGECRIPRDTLVAVSTFSSPRTWIKEHGPVKSYEWVRYASLRDVRVVGGMGKMLKAFADEVHPDDVMSYADASWSEGDAYKALGFECEGMIEKAEFKCLKFRLRFTQSSSSV